MAEGEWETKGRVCVTKRKVETRGEVQDGWEATMPGRSGKIESLEDMMTPIATYVSCGGKAGLKVRWGVHARLESRARGKELRSSVG